VKLFFVSAHSIGGGIERYESLLLAELDRDWIKSMVFLAEGPFPEELRANGYPVTILPTSSRAPGILRTAGRLRRLLRTTQPDVIHADGVKAGLVAVLATLGSGPPVVWVKHDFSWDGPLVRLVAARSRIVVAVSSALTEALGRSRARAQVIHNGLPDLSADAEVGRRALQQATGAGPTTRIVVLFGRLSPIKGHRELVAIAAGLRERVPDIRIVFVGGPDPFSPNEERQLRREVEERRVGDVIAFLGFVQNAHDIVAACDVLALPTVMVGRRGKEGFPFVGLEAMALGTPVVAYAQGGIPEQLGDCGLLVSPGDRDALRDALVHLLLDDELRARLADCGRRRVAERFSVEQMVKAMKACYREAAAGARD
jgi:glycosyltransferase involved in cell wall biosynthesis